MGAKICFTISRTFCIPILFIERWPHFPEPDPRGHIDWLDEIGIDRFSQLQLDAVARISQVGEVLSDEAQKQIGAILEKEIGNMKLPDGVQLKLS